MLDSLDGEVVEFLAVQPQDTDVDFLLDILEKHMRPTLLALQRVLMGFPLALK